MGNAQHAAAAVLEVEKARCTRAWILVEPDLQTNLLVRHHFGQSGKFRREASDRMREIDVVGRPLADDHRSRSCAQMRRESLWIPMNGGPILG